MKRKETYSYSLEDADLGEIKSTLDNYENDQQQLQIQFQDESNELQITQKARGALKYEQLINQFPSYEDIPRTQRRNQYKNVQNLQRNKFSSSNQPLTLTQSIVRNVLREQQQSNLSTRKKRVHIDLKLLQIIVFLFEQKAKNNLISLQSIASRMKLSYTTICKLYRQWSADSSEFKNKFIQKNIKGKKKVLTNFRVQALEKLLHLNPFLTQNQIVQELNKIQILKSPKGSITRFIVYELIRVAGFHKRKCKRLSTKRNELENKKFRKYYCQRYHQLLRIPKRQLDINIFTVRGEGWCRADQDLVLRCPQAKSESTTAFFIFYKNGAFISHTKVGPLQESEIYQLVQKFMSQINQKFPQRKNYFIIDPLNFHTALNYKEFKLKLKIEQILFVPPFSSQLCIVQHFFYNFRQKLRVKKIESQEKLKLELQKIVKEDQSKNFSIFFGRTSYYISMGIQNGDF